MTADARGVTASPLVVILAAGLVLVGIAIVAWGAGKQYKELTRTLEDARAVSEAQQKEIVALRAELGQIRADLADIRTIAAKARTRIVEYRTEAAHASDAVDNLPVPAVGPQLRAVADAYIAEHAQPEPAHQ